MFALLPTPNPPLDPSTLQTLSPTQFAYALPATLSFSHIVLFLLPGSTPPPGTGAGIYIRFPSPPGQPEGEFKLLGGLGEGKGSAIFKVSGGGGRGGRNVNGMGMGVGGGGESDGMGEVDMDADADTDTGDLGELGAGGASAGGVNGPVPVTGDIVVGISIEPLSTLAPQLEALAQSKARIHPHPSGADHTHANGNGTALALYKNPPGGPGERAVETKVLAQRIIKNAFNFLASFSSGGGGGGSGEDVVPLKAFEGWWRKFERRIEGDPGFLEREGGD